MSLTRILILIALTMIAALAASACHAGRLPTGPQKQALTGTGSRPSKANPFVLLADLARLAPGFTGDLLGQPISDSVSTTVTISGPIKASTGRISSAITSLNLHSTSGHFRLTPEGDLDNQAEGSAKLLGAGGYETQYTGLAISSSNLRTAFWAVDSASTGSPEWDLVNDQGDVFQGVMAGSAADAVEGDHSKAILFSTKPIDLQPNGGGTTVEFTDTLVLSSVPIHVNTLAPLSGDTVHTSTAFTLGPTADNASVKLVMNGVSNGGSTLYGEATAYLVAPLYGSLGINGYNREIWVQAYNGLHILSQDGGSSSYVRTMSGSSTNSSTPINLSPNAGGAGAFAVATNTTLTLSALITMRGTAGTKAGKSKSCRVDVTAKNVSDTVTIVNQVLTPIADDSGGAFTAGAGVSGTTLNVTTAADGASTVSSQAQVQGVSAP